MSRIRSWTDQQLVESVMVRKSFRAVMIDLHLIPAGGNYEQVKRHIERLGLDTSHFTGKIWNEGWQSNPVTRKKALHKVLVNGSMTQSFGLKKRLFKAGIKTPQCELCGWAQVSVDGRIPVELDHINGDHYDNRLENLRILCPNCHSLQPTHRGLNKKTLYKYGDQADIIVVDKS